MRIKIQFLLLCIRNEIQIFHCPAKNILQLLELFGLQAGRRYEGATETLTCVKKPKRLLLLLCFREVSTPERFCSV